MKPDLHKEPRSRTVMRFVQLALHHGVSMKAFAASVADSYIAATSFDDRVVDFKVGTCAESAAKANKANAQICQRYLDGTVKTFPADLEEAFVMSLPDDVREQCKAALADRYGLLAARLPIVGAQATQQSTADVMRESGEAIAALLQLVASGSVDARDKAKRELLDVVATATTAIEQIDRMGAQSFVAH
jgi:hypothetical protein